MSRPISLIGEVLPLDVRQGATFGPFQCELRDPPDPLTPLVPGDPVDLTGASFKAQIRKLGLDSGPAPVDLDVVITAPLLGQFEFSASDDAMNLPCGELITDQASLYQWDLVMVDSSGRILPCCFGPVRVYRGVTKPL